jgi:hypothetical protein
VPVRRPGNRLAPAGTGARARVRSTFAADGTAAFRSVPALARLGPGHVFRAAAVSLGRRLAGRVTYPDHTPVVSRVSITAA